jgi:ATP-binding cassette subfamily B protein
MTAMRWGFGAERMQVKRLEAESQSVLDESLKAAKLRAGFIPLIDFLPTLSMVAILWYGGHQVLEGQLQIGDILAFNLYVLMLIWPLRMIGMLIAQASRASAGAGRVHEILETDLEIRSEPGAVALPDGPGAVRLEGVRFGYGPGRAVLNGLDLDIRGGEAVALVGATGSGKTTVARLLPRFYDVDEGRVLIDGVDVRELRLNDVRRAVGIVFEDTFLFSDTVRANIAFADPGASPEDVERAARLAGIHDFIETLPAGYDTSIGEHGFTLSGGQRQRVAIARALIADPRVLILDDATSSVDAAKEHEIRSALGEVMARRTTIIIAHRPATIALADRVVFLAGGRIVAEGTHAQLLATCEPYRQVLARAEAGAEDGGLGLEQPEAGADS